MRLSLAETWVAYIILRLENKWNRGEQKKVILWNVYEVVCSVFGYVDNKHS